MARALININNLNLKKINKMKKLLLTSAIVSSVSFAGNAIAQTTVTGNLDISFKSISAQGTANTTANESMRGFGRESQINIQNKGKLNNGMDYAAGFSIEHDGTETGTNQSFNENTFINITSGNTTVHVGQDHFQNSQRTAANFIGLIAEDITNSTGTSASSDIFLDAVGSNPYASYGIGLLQNVPNIGSFSFLYAPNAGPSLSTASNVHVGDDDGAFDGVDESAFEVGFSGSLGVKGLNAHAFYNKQDAADQAADGTNRDIKGTNLGLNYNFGQVTVGYNNKKSQFTTINSETKQNEFAIAYAISPTLTLGANYTKAKNDSLAAATDAESKSIALGYNLGPVVLTAQYAKTENVTGKGADETDDYDVAIIRASTKF